MGHGIFEIQSKYWHGAYQLYTRASSSEERLRLDANSGVNNIQAYRWYLKQDVSVDKQEKFLESHALQHSEIRGERKKQIMRWRKSEQSS